VEQLTIPPELAAALVDAQLAATAVDKDGWNADKGYSFATSEALLNEGRRALAGSGLAAFATEADFVEEWTTPPEGREPDLVSWCQLSLHLVHRSGQGLTFKIRHPVVFTLKGPDVAKPFGVARTRALGLFVRDLLLLPAFGEDQPEGAEKGDKAEKKASTRGEITEARKVMEEARRQHDRTAARTGKVDTRPGTTTVPAAQAELDHLWAALVKACGGNQAFARGWWEQHQLPNPKTGLLQLERPAVDAAIAGARALVDKVTHNQLTKDPNAVIDTRGT
jgi:hypothetical protein